MLNKECEGINSEKKERIIERSAKKGIKLDSQNVNLLEMQDFLDEEESLSNAEPEEAYNDDHNQSFEIRLQNIEKA